MTSELGIVAGTQAAPGLYISGDTNTGVAQLSGDDTLALVIGGVSKVTASASQVEIIPASTNSINFSSGGVRAGTGHSYGWSSATSGGGGSWGAYLSQTAFNVLTVHTSGVERMRIDASGQHTFAGGTITTNVPAVLVTNTWNSSAVNFEGGLRVDITDTASGANAAIATFRTGATVRSQIHKSGDYFIANSNWRMGRGPTAETTNLVMGNRCNELTTGNGGYNVSIGWEAGQRIDGIGAYNVYVGVGTGKGVGSGAAATGSVNTTAGQPANGDTVTLNGKVYTYQTVLTNVDGNVAIGATAALSASNLSAAVNLGAGSGTAYAAAMTLHPTMSASVSTTTVTLTAKTVGTAGNSLTLAETGPNIGLSGATLTGGTASQTGSYNTAFGASAMHYARTAFQNMAIGGFALQNTTAGSANLALGYSSMLNALGGSNVAIGSFALCNADSTAAEKNICIGYNAGLGVLGSTTGLENVAIGFEALKAFTTGARNTVIGWTAGDAITTGARNICIGQNTDTPSATSSDTLNIGNLIKGDLSGAIITACGAILPDADGTRNIGSGALRFNTVYATTGAINTSDERYKVIRAGGGLNAAELRAWGNVRAIIYQDAHSVAEWGANVARFHAGYGWDAINQAFAAEGLNAARYGLWCADPVMEERTVTETRQRPVLDAEGNPVVEYRPLILEDGTPGMVEETTTVIDMIPTEVPVMEDFEETYLEVEVVNGERVAVLRTRTAPRQATDTVPVFDAAGQPVMGDDGEPMTITVPKTEVVDRPVEREVISSSARMQEVGVYESYEHEMTELVATGEVKGALRYSECAVMEAAWLRHQMADLLARIELLEEALIN